MLTIIPFTSIQMPWPKITTTCSTSTHRMAKRERRHQQLLQDRHTTSQLLVSTQTLAIGLHVVKESSSPRLSFTSRGMMLNSMRRGERLSKLRCQQGALLHHKYSRVRISARSSMA